MKPVGLARAFACAVAVLVATPSEARFLQTDPVGYKDQVNLYEYVGDDPLNKTDPTGTQSYLPPGSTPYDLTVKSCGDDSNCIQNVQKQFFEMGITGLTLAVPIDGLALRGLLALDARATLSFATKEALEGGRNASLVGQFSERSVTSLNRTIRSLTQRIEEHEAKIANPAKYMTRDNPNDPAAVQRAVKDWKGEIRNYKEQRDIAQDVLRSKQCGSDPKLCS